MAAYAAIVPLKELFSGILHYFDAILTPEQLNLCERVHKELKSFQDFLERLDSRSRKRMSASLGRMAEELHESRERLLIKCDDDEVCERQQSLLETLKKMQECYSLLGDEEGVVSSSSSKKMIGLRDEWSELKESLVKNHARKRPVFLLHGMAGIGKTALAREIYEDLDISEWFEYRAWVTLGNEWKSKEITEAILAQVDPDAHKMVMAMGGDEEEMAQHLIQILKLGKRCLIVVDDLWDYDNFPAYMKSVLLHDIRGSRIVLTSRIKDPNATDRWHIFKKRLLNKKESWDFLREKVFAGGSCPPQLEDFGKKFAEKCDGLPLTILTVANLLSKVEESLWTNVAEKRKHQVFIDAYDQISKEIQLRDFKTWKIEVVDSNPLVEKSIKQIMLEHNDVPDHLSVHYSWKSA